MMVRLLMWSLTYVASVHYAYVTYIHPNFEYAYYIYLAPDDVALTSTYALCVLSVLAYRVTNHPAQVIAGLLYALCYVPIQLSILFSVARPYADIALVQALLAFSMAMVFRAAASGPRHVFFLKLDFQSLDRMLGILSAIAILLIIVVNGAHMRFVSFEDVYDLRSEASSGSQNALVGYLSSWLSYCFISYFFARGIVHRKYFLILFGLLGSLVLYMATGAKASLLLLPMTLGVVALWSTGVNFLGRTLLSLIGLILVLTFLLPDEGASLWVKSIVLLRVIGSSGWAASKYFEYFGDTQFTYYTHIGPVNAILNSYPFGAHSLGQMIGLEYFGNDEANFNASFWASDGFAAAGAFGVVLVTGPVMVVLYLINRLTVELDPRFTVAWITGFAVAMLNLPLMTSLLSGGGAIIIFLAWYVSRNPGYRLQKPSGCAADSKT